MIMKSMHMIGNAHLDPVWLWQWQEGYQEVKATFQSALDRMYETPDFVFTCACADYYRWVEENEPDMFKKIQQRVREGRWIIVGGMWIQPDMNTPSGESLARQLLYSQRYFYEKFGMTATTGYNVDTFGHNAMTPQLLRLAGIDSYVWMRPSIVENPDIPEGPMLWESPDGSRVKAFRIFGEYTGARELPEKIDRLFEFSERIGQPVMCYYGVGNHGGGPTKANLREITRVQRDHPQGSEVTFSSPPAYFAELDTRSLPVWKGELQHHASACYSTDGRSKHLHRQTENALLRMEAFGALAQEATAHTLNAPFVRQAWNNLLFNEFHDIMGGCSIREALGDTQIQLHESMSIAAREENAALQKISWQIDTMQGHPDRVRSKETDGWLWNVQGQGTPVVVFNPHSFAAQGPVRIGRPISAVRDNDGKPVPMQHVRSSRTNHRNDIIDGLFMADVPPLGWRLYWVFLGESGDSPLNPLHVSDTVLENSNLRAEFDPATGALVRLTNKTTGFSALTGPTKSRLIDITHCDTWAHGIFRFDQEAGEFGDAEVSVLESGPVRAVVRVVTHYGQSALDQRYILYADADQLEVEVRLDMHEKHRMLKLCFPTAGTADVSEIPYGVLPRMACGNEEHCQRFVAMQGENGGLAVLNNGRYSYSAENGELRMTISNTSVYADHYGQDLRDATCEYMDMGRLEMTYVLHPYAGSWQDAQLNRRAALLNQPMVRVVETYHEGMLPASFSGLSVDDPAVAMGAFKRAENGEGYVLRLHETTGVQRSAMVRIPLLEREMRIRLHGYEIITVYIPDDPKARMREIPLTELEN